MRVVRWVLGIAGAVVLLTVAAALLAMLLVNPDRYKGRIESTVRRQTGRPLLLEGHLQLSWFPWLGVRTGAARLGNLPGDSGPDLIEWRSAQVRVRLLPLLLHRQLQVARIVIAGADVHLRREAGGKDNWDDLIARLHSSPAPRTSPTPHATWAGLDLEDCSLDYVDERASARVTLTDWQLSLGPWSVGEPLSARTRFMLHGQGGGASKLALPATGVSVSLDLPRLQIQTSPLQVTAPRWSLSIADAKLEGSIVVDRGGAGQLTASGSIDAAVTSIRELAGALGITLPVPTDPSALAALSLSGRWSYRDGTLAVNPLTARLDDTRLSGWVMRSGGSRPLWTFALRADDIDLGRYLTRSKQRKPLELPVRALQSLRAQGTVELGTARIDGTVMKNLRLQVQ